MSKFFGSSGITARQLDLRPFQPTYMNSWCLDPKRNCQEPTGHMLIEDFDQINDVVIWIDEHIAQRADQ